MNSDDFCTIINGPYIASYNFNVPHTTYTNTGADKGSLSFVITVTEADDGTQVPSGYSQKNRGLYFDGASEAYVKITGVHLH